MLDAEPTNSILSRLYFSWNISLNIFHGTLYLLDIDVDMGANGTCTPQSAHKFGCKAGDGFVRLGLVERGPTFLATTNTTYS